MPGCDIKRSEGWLFSSSGLVVVSADERHVSCARHAVAGGSPDHDLVYIHTCREKAVVSVIAGPSLRLVAALEYQHAPPVVNLHVKFLYALRRRKKNIVDPFAPGPRRRLATRVGGKGVGYLEVSASQRSDFPDRGVVAYKRAVCLPVTVDVNHAMVVAGAKYNGI